MDGRALELAEEISPYLMSPTGNCTQSTRPNPVGMIGSCHKNEVHVITRNKIRNRKIATPGGFAATSSPTEHAIGDWCFG